MGDLLRVDVRRSGEGWTVGSDDTVRGQYASLEAAMTAARRQLDVEVTATGQPQLGYIFRFGEFSRLEHVETREISPTQVDAGRLQGAPTHPRDVVRPPSQEFASTTADRTVQHAPVGANVDAIVSGFEAMFARARSEGDPPPADLQSTLKNFGGQKPIEAPAFARWIGRGLEWFEEWIKRNEGLKHAFVEVIHEASEFRRHLPR